MYTWDPAQKFTLTGKEFAAVSHALRGILETEEAKKILATLEAAKIVERLLEQGVKEGTVIQAKE